MERQFINLRSSKGVIFCADAIELFEEIGAECADIVFLDPPFNLGKRYSDVSELDRRPQAEYARWLTTIIELSANALKPGGALFLYHLPVWALRLGYQADKVLTFRHWISISMKNGFARGKRLYPAHYALLYFTKGSPGFFFRPKIDPLSCPSCGEFVRDYGGYRKIIEAKGVNLSDIWDDLSPVRHGSKKHRQANELPIELFNRMITISGRPGMTYVDPFAGSGAGALAAARMGLDFLVGDVVKENVAIIQQRLKDAQCSEGP